MKAKTALNHLRSKLRDIDINNARFSNAELLSALENSQNKIITEFENNICHFTFRDNERLILPFVSLGLMSAKLNGKALKYKPLTTILQTPKGLYLYSLNPREYKLTQDYSGVLELFVNSAEVLESEEDELFLDKMFLNALLYQSLAFILQIETTPNSLNKVVFFDDLYKKECGFLRSLTNKQRERGTILTPFIKV